jgi:glycosyltransferase involved in cell wall biosynthesis
VSDSVRVSVVMPLYNAEKYVKSALGSALASDLRELEVIVVDDGSRDASAAIVAAIDDPRVTLLRTTPPSGGPSRPRNTGIARARAPYIALLDADDLLKPHKLSAAIAALERHPQAGFVFGDFERIDAQGALLEASTLAGYPVFQSLAAVELQPPWRLIPQAELARGLLYENFIGTSGVVMRKELLDEIGGFDETLVCSEDRDLWFRAAHHGAALYCNEVGHSYRVIPSSLSHGPVIRNARCRIAVLQREKARWTDAAARAQVKQLITENLANIAYAYWRSRRRFAAVLLFLQVFARSGQLRWLRGAFGSLLP